MCAWEKSRPSKFSTPGLNLALPMRVWQSTCPKTLAPSLWVILEHKNVQKITEASYGGTSSKDFVSYLACPRPCTMPPGPAAGLATCAQGCKHVGGRAWKHGTWL